MSATLGLERLPGRCPDGFDLATQHPGLCACIAAEHGKTSGIDAANENAPTEIKARIDQAIQRLASTGREFSANDMRADLEGVAGPVVGGRFNAAARAGVIRKTGRRVPSNLASTHAHELTVWTGAAA